MKLTDMRVTDAEKKAREQKLMERVPGDSGPDYPYGLSIHLDEGSLLKLKVKDLPKAGDVVHVEGTAKVRAVRQEEVDGGEKERHVELQITELAFGSDADAREDDASTLYDGAGARKSAAASASSAPSARSAGSAVT